MTKFTQNQYEKAKESLENIFYIESQKNRKILIDEYLEKNSIFTLRHKLKIKKIASKGDIKPENIGKYKIKDDDVYTKSNELILYLTKKDLCYKKDLYKYFVENKEVTKNDFIYISYKINN
jgi:hypothetical protein